MSRIALLFAFVTSVCVSANGQSSCDDCNPFYAGLSGGLSLLHDSEDAGVTIEYDPGLAFNGFIGWQESFGRVEFEVSRFNNEVSSLAGTTVNSGSGDVYAYMLNLYRDLPITSQINGYVGAGAGVAQIEANSVDNTFGAFINARSSLGAAYQFRTGLSKAVSNRADLFGGYRFLGTEKLSLSNVGFGGDIYGDQIYSHSLEAGLRFKF